MFFVDDCQGYVVVVVLYGFFDFVVKVFVCLVVGDVGVQYQVIECFCYVFGVQFIQVFDCLLVLFVGIKSVGIGKQKLLVWKCQFWEGIIQW